MTLDPDEQDGAARQRPGAPLRRAACSPPAPSRAVLPVPGATEEWVLLLRSLATARVLRDRAAQAKTRDRRRLRASSAARPPPRWRCAASRSPRSATRQTPQKATARRRGRTADPTAGSRTRRSNSSSATRSSRFGEGTVKVNGDEPPGGPDPDGRGRRPRAPASAPTRELITEDGRIVVDEHMRTSAEDVYAVGDVAFAFNPRAGRHLAVEHWGEALNMGEVAGRTIAGEDAQWDVAPGFWSSIGTHTLKYAAWGDGFDETRAGRARQRRVDDLVRRARAPPWASSRTSATTTTRPAASWWRAEPRCRDPRRRRRPRAQRGGADRRLRRARLRPSSGIARDEYEIVVVLDRCTDATADRAQAAGERAADRRRAARASATRAGPDGPRRHAARPVRPDRHHRRRLDRRRRTGCRRNSTRSTKARRRSAARSTSATATTCRRRRSAGARQTRRAGARRSAATARASTISSPAPRSA